MKLLNEDLKNGNLKQVYLLYGEEAYLRKQYRDRLRKALAGDDAMNCHCFEGKGIKVREVIDLAETLPFLAKRRVIIIEDSGLFKKGGEALADYIPNMAESACFVFVETEVDKRNRLFKAVKNQGRVTEFTRQDENTLRRWIQDMAKKENKRISDRVTGYFLEKTGVDMANIRMELDKLFCFAIDREEITERDVDAICTRRISNQIFDMINAIADKNRKKALDLYYDLLALKEPPMRILFLMARQFNLLLQVKELKGKGYDKRVIAEKTGLHGFVAGKYLSQSSKFDRETLKKALTDCVEWEERVKTGKLRDVMSVELLIMTYSDEEK